jgi:hypothetical protein
MEVSFRLVYMLVLRSALHKSSDLQIFKLASPQVRFQAQRSIRVSRYFGAYLTQPSNLFTIYPRTSVIMTDFSFGGSEEENAELKKLNAEVVSGIY